MSTNTKRLLIWIGAGIAVVALILPKFGALRGTSKGSAASSGPRTEVLVVRTYVVHPEKLSNKVSTVGTILANEEVELRSEIPAKVTRLFFREGSKVKKGSVLVKINDAEQQAQLLRAQHRQTLAEQAENRQRQLFEKNLTSQEEHETTITELNVVKAEVEVIKAQIARTQIVAPYDGVIGLRYVSEGSYVTPSTRNATLHDLASVKIDFSVAEKYAGNDQGRRLDRSCSFAQHGPRLAGQPKRIL